MKFAQMLLKYGDEAAPCLQRVSTNNSSDWGAVCFLWRPGPRHLNSVSSRHFLGLEEPRLHPQTRFTTP